MVQFAYNSLTHSITKVSPFYANYGKEPMAFHEPYSQQQWEQRASLDVEKLKTLHQQMKLDLNFINQRMAL